jgi:hypothetical protein
MKQLIPIHFNSLPNAAHCTFCLNVNTTLTSSPQEITDALGNLVPDFATLLAEEELLEDWVRKSTLTAKIEEADHAMDAALTALRTTIRGMRTFSVVAIADTATHVYTMLMDYGHVNIKPYEEQIGNIESILRQITEGGDYYDAVNALKKVASIVGGMIVDLNNTFNTFRNLLSQRDKRSLKKPERTFLPVRRDIEAVYHKIAVIINAGIVMKTSPAFVDFVNELNPEIERLNAEFHRARTRLTPAHTSVEPVPMQSYTGMPITPLPRVFFQTEKETLELELGKDFSLTYRNNTEVGEARLIVHGKGAYIGTHETSFYIAR